MGNESLPLIEVSRLRLGMYVVLDLGWKNHPFALNSFTLRTLDQLDQLRALGVEKIRYCPDRSTAEPLPAVVVESAAVAVEGAPAATRAARPSDPLTEQEAMLRQVETAYRESAQQYQRMSKLVQSEPIAAAEAAEGLAETLSAVFADGNEVAVRLLGQSASDTAGGHEIGVAALALLLGRDCGFSPPALRELALAAVLHDLGKLRVPAFLHEDHGQLTDFERRSYQRHVEFGIEFARTMGLPASVLTAIGEHHERADGSGFPLGLRGDRLSLAGRALAIVNRYHNLICPLHAEAGQTPHRALQRMYREERAHFDPVMLPRFVRVLGVYPPGTLVELTDQRTAIVVATQPGMTLAPQVQILDHPDDFAPRLAVDLDPTGGVGVRRGLQPEQLGERWAQRARQLARAAFFLQPVSQAEKQAA